MEEHGTPGLSPLDLETIERLREGFSLRRGELNVLALKYGLHKGSDAQTLKAVRERFISPKKRDPAVKEADEEKKRRMLVERLRAENDAAVNKRKREQDEAARIERERLERRLAREARAQREAEYMAKQKSLEEGQTWRRLQQCDGDSRQAVSTS